MVATIINENEKPINYVFLKKEEIIEPGTLVYDLILKSLAMVLRTKIRKYCNTPTIFYNCKDSDFHEEKHELFYLKEGKYKYVRLINKQTNFEIL